MFVNDNCAYPNNGALIPIKLLISNCSNGLCMFKVVI